MAMRAGEVAWLAAIVAIAISVFAIRKAPEPNPGKLSAFDTPAPNGMVDLIFGNGAATVRLPITDVGAVNGQKAEVSRLPPQITEVLIGFPWGSATVDVPSQREWKKHLTPISIEYDEAFAAKTLLPFVSDWQPSGRITEVPGLDYIPPPSGIGGWKIYEMTDHSIRHRSGVPVRFYCRPSGPLSPYDCLVDVELAARVHAKWSLAFATARGERLELPMLTMEAAREIVPYLQVRTRINSKLSNK